MSDRYYMSGGGRYVFHADHVAEPEHMIPVVVIDFEDREQVERLVAVFLGIPHPFSVRVDDMQAALREFANPQPIKPPEPTGLGAVVRAVCPCHDEPLHFVRDPDARDFNLVWDAGPNVARGDEVPWVSRCGHHRYDALTAVEVLNDGYEVTP